MTNSKAIKRQLLAAVAMVIVAAVALGSSTYAWFVNNNAVTATGIDLSTTSSVPNLYITSTGKTTDAMTAADNNPTKLYPVSTNNANNFYETLHWTSAAVGKTHAVADQYQAALEHETGKTVYADYTFKLGVTNGTMDVYFDSAAAATTLKASTTMGTAGRFAIKFDDGNWFMFKVPGTATSNGYYTDQAAENEADNKDYWVTGEGGNEKCVHADYDDMADYSGRIEADGSATAGTTKLTTISDTATQTVTVRVWYEGCDKDCVSENAGQGIANAIVGNLGFVGVQVG